MIVEPLNGENVTATFDPETRIASIVYTGELTPPVTTQAYGWVISSALQVGVENIYGGYFDFRNVTKFRLENVRTVKRAHKSKPPAVDFSRIPTSLIVKNMYQEQMVRVSMRVNEQSDRLRIVHSEEEALNFVNEWHQLNNAAS